jgi:radical SAM superfamily enzyme YgiQ (UPF0313 family)
MLISLPGINQNDGDLFPLGIGYLAGSLKNRHEVESHHFAEMAQARKEMRKRLRAYRPDILGLTCSSFNRSYVREMIRYVRGVDKGIKLVVGGVHPSFCTDQMLRQYGADVVVIGEGERTLPELCSALEQGAPLEGVHGISYKEGDRILMTSPREPVKNLDELPIPDYSYARPFIERSRTGFLITSRGCPVRCTFCSTSSYWGQKVRMHSPKRVVDEIEMLVSQFDIKKIFFHDDTFNIGIPRVLEICRGIKDRGVEVDWACSCRVVPVSEEMIATMVESGCRHICWGVESGSEGILRSINKKISLGQIRNAFEVSTKFRHVLSTGAFSMVGNPGETEKTIRETVAFFNSTPITDAPSTSILYVLPGTLLYETMKGKGQIREEDWLYHKTVPTYTMENSFYTLMKWNRMVMRSGEKIPFDPTKHFWHTEANSSGVVEKIRTKTKNISRTVVGLMKVATHIHEYFLPGHLHY